MSFGASFTPATFDLQGVSRALPAGKPVALVARLPDSVGLGDVRLVVASVASRIVDQPVARGVFPSPWSFVDAGPRLFATTVVFPSPGTYRCELRDRSGAILASGSFLAL